MKQLIAFRDIYRIKIAKKCVLCLEKQFSILVVFNHGLLFHYNSRKVIQFDTLNARFFANRNRVNRAAG